MSKKEQFDALYNFFVNHPKEEIIIYWGSGRIKYYFYNNKIIMYYNDDWLDRQCYTVVNHMILNNENDFYEFAPADDKVTLHWVKKPSENQWSHYCNAINREIKSKEGVVND